LQQRAQLPQAADVPPNIISSQREKVRSEIGGFVQESKDTFVHSMHITSFFAAISAFLTASAKS